MVSPTRARVTLEEYLATPETMQPMELIDGVIDMAAAPALNHQRYIVRVLKLIDQHMPDGEVFPSPVDVVTDDAHVLQPDVLWVAASNDHCVEQQGRLYGPPDLVVEILSPSTARKDRTKKFNAYEAAGVREYWIVDPTLESIEVWVLKDTEYTLNGAYRTPQSFVSPALNAADLPLTDIFPQTA